MKIIVKDGAFEDAHYTKEARDIASFVIDKLKLSFDDVEFRLVDNDTMAEQMAIYGDPLPTWYTGQEYMRARNQLLGLHSNLYEMVGHVQKDELTNKTRTIVYLNKSDTEDEILSVIAHVYGHLHVEKNNFLAKGSKQNIPKHNYYRRRFRALEELVGKKGVEQAFDDAQTLSSLIDLYPDFRPDTKDTYYTQSNKVPVKDEYNVFDFIMEQANMPDWRREIFGMVRDIYSLMKVARIKIIHEGFATFVEEKYALERAKTDTKTALRMIDSLRSVADPISDVQMPYAMGWRLFKDIETRWNEGKHGLEYEMLSREEKLNYKREENRGIDKVLQVVELEDDWNFLFSYATKDFIMKYMQEAMENLELLYSTYLDEDDRKYRLPFILQNFQDDHDPDDLRFSLLYRSESYLPSIYIQAGGFNYKPPRKDTFSRGLLLKEDLSILDRYVRATDPVEKEEELAEVTQRFAQYLTLDNENTHKAMHRMAKLLRRNIYLDTIDQEGDRIIIASDGTQIKYIELDPQTHD